MLDPNQFASLDDAFANVEPGDRYAKAGAMLIPLAEEQGGLPMTMAHLFAAHD